MEVKKIGILGAGLMGTGIAQTAAQSGFDVLLKDVSRELLRKSLDEIKSRINRLVEKGNIDAFQADDAIKRVKITVDSNDFIEIDYLIEAVTEDLKLKREVFGEFDKICQNDVVFATNTSCLMITEIAGTISRADKIVGMHFFYPVPLMKLVEITPGFNTSEETVQIAKAVAEKLSKVPVLAKDTPGFIVNRLLVPFINEAIKLVEEGVKPEDIDTALKLGANLPMGPMELADFISLDGLLNSITTLYNGLQDEKYKPRLLLKKMVQAGMLGRKNKKGFYNYEK
ncbi:MAG: 3-hydroxybutyryl-CoA dehydrogenase [Actinobacteria bacterium]|nr:3-hydroxybutyryl-CoA dehydrogenase [Actinomycetota bacterium]